MDYEEARQQVLAALPKGGEGAEIGVWKGDFSARILETVRPSRLHLIDPWQVREDPSHASAWYGAARGQDMDAIHAQVQARFAAVCETGQVVIHRKASTEALPTLPAGALDFVYVDGDHSHDAVRTDLALAWPLLRVGGFLCVDDYLLGRWWGDGVVRAVHEFLGAHAQEAEIVLAWRTQVVIRKR